MTRWMQFQLLMPMEKEVAKTSVQIVLTSYFDDMK
jgi:hypothetical protein